jgi:hypothetical protein
MVVKLMKYYCREADDKEMQKSQVILGAIPEWCPLEDADDE